MPSYIIEEKKGHNYIVESIPYWDVETKTRRSKKSYIGKINKDTGKLIFKDDFINNYNSETISIKGQAFCIKNNIIYNNGTLTEINDLPNMNIQYNCLNNIYFDSDTDLLPLGTRHSDISNHKSFGGFYFITQIAKKMNLIDILKHVFPNDWEFIVNLSAFILLINKRMDKCQIWFEDTYAFPVPNMDSPRISELFNDINKSQINKFHQYFLKSMLEDEYIALDTTSISSYSKNNEFIDFGHSKDNKKLSQANLCMLFGEKSYLPVYYTIYNGSLTDSVTLENTLNEFSALVSTKKFGVVMDKGFYSENNINLILRKDQIKFILGVPFSTNYAKELVYKVHDQIQNMNNYIKTTNQGENIKGLGRKVLYADGNFEILDDNSEIKCNNVGFILQAYIYFNNNKYIRESNKLCAKINDIKNEILESNKILKKNKGIAERYLNITQSSDKKTITSIEINNDAVYKDLQHEGYTILLTNTDFDCDECYSHYINKDVVEKSFNHYKSHLGLDRPYVHGHKRMINKTFIIFLCQIIYSYIHKQLHDKDFFKTYSIEKLFMILNNHRCYTVNNQLYLRPLTKKQKDILSFFDIPEPNT